MEKPVKVSVIIKALNEENNIEAAISSSLAAVAPYDGQVILADSGSSDRTIERAMNYPITIVQLCRPHERCCGIGPQLGYQHSSSEYVYILDGDMKVSAAFLARAIEFLDHNPSVAGVGGMVKEMRVGNLELRARVQRLSRKSPKADAYIHHLAGGGLYRRVAVQQVGYLSDRNLHAYEEYDLGARLRNKGWRLVRLQHHAVDHYSYKMGTRQLLWHRIRSGYALSTGEIIHAAIQAHYLKNALADLRGVIIAIGVWVYWLSVAIIFSSFSDRIWVAGFLLFAILAPVLGMSLRTRSLQISLFSVLLWHVNAIGLILGLIRPRIAPTMRIESRILRESSSGVSS